MEETPESLYAERFKAEKLGPNVISLAKKVILSGVRLTEKGSPIPGDVVVDINNGHEVMLEEDLRIFHAKVKALGEYNESSSFRMISDFLSATPVLVGPQEDDSTEPTTTSFINS